MNKVKKFIYDNWDGTLRYEPKDREKLIGLPYPYNVPCVNDMFDEMYYWGTYFTNKGLILSGKTEYAKNNTSNVAFLINKYGFMPNGNRFYYLSRSQPPFFTAMVRDVYAETGDRAWLAEMYGAGKREYDFWQTRRMTPSGLNRYYYNEEGPVDFDKSTQIYCRRLNIAPPTDVEEKKRYTVANITVCESGWDCNSRFGMLRNSEYNWVDLNCLLYGMERDMASFAAVLGNGEEHLWSERADARREKMNELCWNDKLGAFCDYDFVNGKVSDFVSAASLYAMFVGLCTEEQAAATARLLDRLEQPFGLSCCEKREDLLNLQWDYPHGWACLHYIAIEGLHRYGYSDIAHRLALKYCDTVERNFALTGNLWEKYNVVTGEVSRTKESARQITIMSWSASVYLYCADLCDR